MDGPLPNRVVEMNSVPVPTGATNPYGGAFQMQETELRTESEAQRNLDLATSRKWIVTNPSARNALGHSTGYALLPGENAVPFAQPDSWVRKRAAFLNSHVWVTPYQAGEIYAGGNYPNQSRGGDGLPRWAAANRTIHNQDVVLWYSMGVTHNPRPEDWPVMPVHAAGFQLVPWGFFEPQSRDGSAPVVRVIPRLRSRRSANELGNVIEVSLTAAFLGQKSTDFRMRLIHTTSSSAVNGFTGGSPSDSDPSPEAPFADRSHGFENDASRGPTAARGVRSAPPTLPHSAAKALAASRTSRSRIDRSCRNSFTIAHSRSLKYVGVFVFHSHKTAS